VDCDIILNLFVIGFTLPRPLSPIFNVSRDNKNTRGVQKNGKWNVLQHDEYMLKSSISILRLMEQLTQLQITSCELDI